MIEEDCGEGGMYGTDLLAGMFSSLFDGRGKCNVHFDAKNLN